MKDGGIIEDQVERKRDGVGILVGKKVPWDRGK